MFNFDDLLTLKKCLNEVFTCQVVTGMMLFVFNCGIMLFVLIQWLLWDNVVCITLR